MQRLNWEVGDGFLCPAHILRRRDDRAVRCTGQAPKREVASPAPLLGQELQLDQ
ncbi:MAG TPA: hypothetical protein VMS17_22070 [Gemmataceae bacterium]|nr:hypothetical protein [Gemmataceae bacterium]